MKKKALIFYISRYSGHYHAACAIEEGLLKTTYDIEVKKINALNYTNPILGKIINKAYLEIIKKKPDIWGHIYDNPDVIKKTEKARDALHRYNMSKMKKLLESFLPDFVICTQAFPCGMVADYKRTSGKRIPLIGVLTDHAPHSYWLYDEVDFYVVPFEETAGALEKKGVSRERIRVFGIPVDPKFRKAYDKCSIRRQLGLVEDSPTILIMGGSQGLGVVEETVKSLLEDSNYKYQLLVVAGSNKKLYRRIERLNSRGIDARIHLFSYIEHIDQLMEAADIIVTKAGGMTIAESLVKRLPLAIVNPIPGHERMNADFLVEKGAAIEVKNYENITEKIGKLFDSKNALDNMIQSIESLAKPDSAVDIAKLALES